MACDRSPVPFDHREDDSERLATHPETGFTPGEISERTGISRENVEPTLRRLKARALVRDEESGWTIGRDDRLAAYSAMILGSEAASDHFENEDWGDWKETAVDPRSVAANDGTRNEQP